MKKEVIISNVVTAVITAFIIAVASGLIGAVSEGALVGWLGGIPKDELDKKFNEKNDELDKKINKKNDELDKKFNKKNDELDQRIKDLNENLDGNAKIMYGNILVYFQNDDIPSASSGVKDTVRIVEGKGSYLYPKHDMPFGLRRYNIICIWHHNPRGSFTETPTIETEWIDEGKDLGIQVNIEFKDKDKNQKGHFLLFVFFLAAVEEPARINKKT